MGLKNEVSTIFLERKITVTRPSQNYTTAVGAYNLFNIAGGAVEIFSMGGIITAAAVGAETLAITVNGVGADAAAVAINGAVGTVFYSSLNVAGTMLNAAAVPITVATLTTMISGIQPAGAVGVIIGTFAAGTDCTCQFWVVYKRLSPASNIAVA